MLSLAINFFFCIIDRESGTYRHLVAEGTESGLGAVVSGTYGNAFLVEQLSHLRCRDARDVERDDAHPLLRIAHDGDAWDAADLLTCILGEFMLMAFDVVDAHTLHEVECITESDGIGNVGCASLESGWRHIELGALDGHILNHVASTLPWWELFEPFFLSIHHTDARWTINLVS